MEKVYEELEEVKAENEKLRMEFRCKTELLENLKKLQNGKSAEIREARLVIEKQGFEIEEKTREISELKRSNEDLRRCLREKDCVVKSVNEANDKLRANVEDKYREFEEEKRKLVLALDEASEKIIDLEQRNNVYRAEIEGLKGVLAAEEKKRIQVEKTAKDLKESRGRDDVMMKMEEEKSKVEEKLKWKKEQFKHLKEAYEKLENLFEANKKEREEERSTLLDEIYSLQTKLDSQTRISDDLQKKLQICNGALSQEETRRKHLEIQVSEFKARYEDAFAECQDARTRLDELAGKRDEEVAELRQSLTMKESYFKEMKYEKGKLEQENQELLASLKELQEATIQGSGNSALTKLKNRFRKLENIHKNCSVHLKSKEAEWSSQLEKMEEDINDHKLHLESKEAALQEVELELENSRSSTAKMMLEYEEISIMFLVLSRTVSEAQSKLANVKYEEINDEKREENSCSLLFEQLEQKNAALAKAHEEIEEEREKVACLLQRIEMLDLLEEQNLQMQKEVERYKETVEESSRLQTQMKAKMKEAEKDYEEKLLQVCDALDNTNSDLVAEREKVAELTRRIESFCIVKEKNLVMEEDIRKHKELLEESEKRRVVLEELESDSKETIRELCSKLDIAYAKLAEEVAKTASLTRKTESLDQDGERRRKELDNYKEMLEEASKSQLLLQEKVADVSEALETANGELSDKTSEVYQVEFQLWVWKSIAKRLKAELEQNQNLRKRVEASLLEQVGVGEAMRQERNELKQKLKSVTLLLEEKQNEANVVYKAWEKLAASKILTEVETEANTLMIIELEEEIEKLETLDESVACFREKLEEVTTQMQKKLTTSEAEKAELVKEVSSLSSERRNLLCLIGELENRMSKLCDEDMKLMKSLERITQCCDGNDGFGKENNNNTNSDTIESPRLVMKHHEAVAIEDRSPFRQLNH